MIGGMIEGVQRRVWCKLLAAAGGRTSSLPPSMLGVASCWHQLAPAAYQRRLGLLARQQEVLDLLASVVR